VFGYVISTFCWMLVPYSILLAFGLRAIRPGVPRWLATGLMVLAVLRGLQNYYAERPPPLDTVAEYIRNHARQDDGVIFTQVGWGTGVVYYLQSADHLLAGLGIGGGNSAPIQTAAEAFRNPRDWLVLPDGEVPAVEPAALASRMDLADEQRFGSIRVLRFDRRE
jgi:hypothetical protein